MASPENTADWQTTSLTDESWNQPSSARHIGKIKFRDQALQRRCSVQLPNAENRRIADAPAESFHLVTVACRWQRGRAHSQAGVSLIDRESHLITSAVDRPVPPRIDAALSRCPWHESKHPR